MLQYPTGRRMDEESEEEVGDGGAGGSRGLLGGLPQTSGAPEISGRLRRYSRLGVGGGARVEGQGPT